MTNMPPQPAVIFTIPEALQALDGLVAATPTVAIVGTLTAFKKGRRWATGEIATHKPNGDVLAQLRISFPPQCASGRAQLEVGNTVRVTGRFTVDNRYGPVQFQVSHTIVLEDRAESASAVDRLTASIRHEGLHRLQQRFRLGDDANRLLVVCPVNQGAGGTDFIDRLQASKHDWDLEVLEVPMGNSDSGFRIAAAVSGRADRSPADAIVLCRGGGSPAELAPFDSEHLARAIVEASKPVVVAVGHSDDRHVADLVAFKSCPTPTAAAEWFIRRRETQHRVAVQAAIRIREVRAEATATAAEQLASNARRATLVAAAAACVFAFAVLFFIVRGLS